MEDDYKGSNTRECFRIEYPFNDRPRIRIGEEDYIVLNLSEKGGKFLNRNDKRFELDATLTGTIRLKCGENIEIASTVVRVFSKPEGAFVVCFEKWVPLKLIIAEQRFLLSKYKYSTE